MGRGCQGHSTSRLILPQLGVGGRGFSSRLGSGPHREAVLCKQLHWAKCPGTRVPLSAAPFLLRLYFSLPNLWWG